MSGHSKWATIKRSKEAADSKRSSMFAKISRDIIIAAKVGQSGDIQSNPLLRLAVNRAKAVNMPSDRIDRAINRGLGILPPGEQFFEKRYEAYSNKGIPLLIDVETNNANRALTEIRTIVTKNGGKLVSEGEISWQFEELGYVKITLLDRLDIDSIQLELMEFDGLRDILVVNSGHQKYIEIYIERDRLRDLSDWIKNDFKDSLELEELGIKVINKSADLLSNNDSSDLEDFLDKIREYDEVTAIWF